MGLDIGLEKSGRFRVKAVVEKEQSFCDTIRANRDAGRLDRNLVIFQNDIRKVDPAEVLKLAGLKPGQLDVLIGGPPCQSYSTAGRRGTTQDPRGTLLWDFLRFVEYMRPKFFLMENVRGLLSAAINHRPISERPEKGGAPLAAHEQPGSVVRLFADDLQRMHTTYHMDCFEVNAVNYGAPQLRERALFIGNRYGAQVDFPNPTHGNPIEVSEPSSDLFEAHRASLPWRTLGDAISQLDGPGEVIMDFSPRKKSYLRMVPAGSNWRSLPIAVQKESMGAAWRAKGGRSGWWRRLSFDLPCPTLVTMPNHASTSLCHPSEVRALSLKEYAAIQEFPSDWEFRGTVSKQYEQVGNAVPVRLGAVAGVVISEALDKLEARQMRPYKEPPSHYRVIYVQSHIRTRQWYRGGESFAWEDGESNMRASYERPQTRRRVSTLG